MPGTRIDVAEAAELVRRYEKGETLLGLQNSSGRHRQTIARVLADAGVPVIQGRQRRRKLNEAFFDEIVTEHQAYWLGFLTADGSVTGSPRQCVQINLADTDKEHLNKFRTAVASDAPFVPNGSCVLLGLYSRKMVSALGALGVMPRKSTREIPWNGNANLMRHYFRGLFDGDGCICRYVRRGRVEWQVGLVGSAAVISAFSFWLHDRIGVAAKQPRTKGAIFQVAYSGTKLPRSIVSLLYADAQVYLDRKYALASKLMREV